MSQCPQARVWKACATATKDGRAKQGPLVVDGSRILFTENLPGPQLVLAATLGKGGETTTFANPFKQPKWTDISPDRAELLVLTSDSEAPYSMWIMPVAGGSPWRVGTLEVNDASWCRDSKTIVYSLGPDIYMANEDGTTNSKLATAPGNVSRLRWSPHGGTLRFSVADRESDRTSLWQVSVNGSELHALLPVGMLLPRNVAVRGHGTANTSFFSPRATEEQTSGRYGRKAASGATEMAPPFTSPRVS